MSFIFESLVMGKEGLTGSEHALIYYVCTGMEGHSNKIIL